MKQKFEQREIFKEKFRELCKKHNITLLEVLRKLELPRNYVTLLGLVRIATFFEVNISSLFEN